MVEYASVIDVHWLVIDIMDQLAYLVPMNQSYSRWVERRGRQSNYVLFEPQIRGKQY